ncbi:MAG TPA: ankyrin repeat domain-containing protein [Pyrinomonadaceae bacterium]|nr:ankyrin repeat domain-containing protein [Pyrinomonadaceae bacterium]
MAVPRKLIVVPNEATRELWRIADTGETDDLEAVLQRADINARNKHGMTALMRAAHHGRVGLVRVLLEHGADPNLERNDNFTALSLAAFFGHAEIVEVLMQHGAKTDVATRFGTSPQIWAKARSYGDVARCLEKRSEDVKPVSTVPPVVSTKRKPEPEPEPEPEVEQPVEPIVVRTLKDPPEIWDLVQEAPRNFNARSAFMGRMGRLNGALAVTLVVLLVIAAGAVAAFYFRNKLPVRLSSVPTQTSASVPAATAPATTVPAPVVNQASDVTTNVTPESPVVATEPANVEVISTPINRRPRSFARPRATGGEVENQPATVETAVAPPAVTLPKPEPKTSLEVDAKKSTATANSQMVAPPKPTPPKAKVIQWP